MLISSKAKLVPVLTSTNLKPYFRIYSVNDRRYVEYRKHDKDNAFGEIYREGRFDMDKEVFINLTCDANLKKAAKRLLELRPNLDSEYPAAVLLCDHIVTEKCTNEVEWRKVSIDGTFTLFNGADPEPVPPNDGDHISSRIDSQVFFSPMSVIKMVKAELDAAIVEMLSEAKEREDKEKALLKKAKPLIDKIIKAQEI